MNINRTSLFLQLMAATAIIIMLASCKAERQDILQCVSPHKAYVATFYRMYGGGAAGWQQEYVSVRRVVGGEEKVVLEMNHGYDVVLTWLSPMKLKIAYPDSARLDPWQSHFDQRLEGGSLLNWTTVLRAVKSKDGSFVDDKTRCGN